MKIVCKVQGSILLAIMLAAGLGACSQDEEEALKEAREILPEHAAAIASAEKVQSLIFDAVEMANYHNGLEKEDTSSSSGAIITSARVHQGRMIFSLDYGSKGLPEGSFTRAGAVFLTSYVENEGVNLVYNLQDYVVNGYRLAGTVRITRFVRDAANEVQYHLHVEDAEVQTPQGGLYRITREWRFTQRGGRSLASGVFEVEGTGSVELPGGSVVTQKIIKPLTIRAACQQAGEYIPSDGIIQSSFGGNMYYQVQYSEANCKARATLQAGNQQQILAL